MITDPNIRAFLAEAVARTVPFFEDRSERMYIERNPTSIRAACYVARRTMFVTAESKHPLLEFETVACFGSLKYLAAILDMPQIKTAGQIEFNYAKASNGDRALKTIRFIGKRAEFLYQASDPFIGQNDRRKGTNSAAVPAVSFVIAKDAVKEFEEMARVSGSADDKAALFTLAYDKSMIKASFGKGGQVGKITMAENVETDDLSKPVTALFDIAQFRGVMKMVSGNVSKVKLMEKGVIFESVGEEGVYTYAMTARKDTE